MKNILAIVLLMLLGSITSGYISSANPVRDSKRVNYTRLVNKPSPEMVFPVAGKKARIGSFWGAIRDGGSRKHEGIDIFAAKKTPVVAVRDGVVTTTGNGGRGGKYIWLKSFDDQFTYYYAHLDQQYVKPGQSVKKGQVIGTVGNTGNAKLTPPHLHFGMYSYSGAVDPLPYVKNLQRLPVQKQPELLASKSTKKAVTAEKSAVVKKPAPSPADKKNSPIAARHIWKTLKVPADPNAKYYVTVRSNVVRVHKNELAIVGKYQKHNSQKYPYKIVLANNQHLLVSSSGNIITESGQVVGQES